MLSICGVLSSIKYFNMKIILDIDLMIFNKTNTAILAVFWQSLLKNAVFIER